MKREVERGVERLGENPPLYLLSLNYARQSACVYIQQWSCQSTELSQLADIADSHLMHRKQMRVISILKFNLTGNLGKFGKEERARQTLSQNTPPNLPADETSSFSVCLGWKKKKKKSGREMLEDGE